MTSTAVVCSEILKLIFSIILHSVSIKNTIKNTINEIKSDMINDKAHMARIALQSALYVIQNNLQYIAMSNLPAGIYQIFAQTKIVSTALFSLIIFKRKQKLIQYLSVLGVTAGTIIAQFSPNSNQNQQNTNMFIGFISVIASSLTSGYAGVYFEKTVKENSKGRSIWLNNAYMALVSIFFALINVCVKDYKAVISHGFFKGYDDPIVSAVILVQALGGLLVSLVVRQTDSVTKGIAASGSVVLSSLISSLILKEYDFSIQIVISVFLVCISSYLYATAHRTDDMDFSINIFKHSEDKLKDSLKIWKFLYGYELFPKNN
jgi:UDP-galactose transporter